MLILVAVTVTVALRGGLFDTAKRAAQKTKEEAEAERNMYEAEYYMARANGETDAETFTDYMLEEYYGGVEIGDYVAYEEGTYTYTPDTSKGVATEYPSGEWVSGVFKYNNLSSSELETQDFGWRVLGVSDTGALELISDDVTSEKIYLVGKESWLYGPDELSRMCDNLYGKGTYSSGARSINVDDINKITGYNPEKTGDGQPFGYGTVAQYGNEVTFTLNGEGKVQYTSSVANGTYNATSFTHPDGRTLGENNVESITLKADYYYYYPASRQTGPQEYSPAYLDSNSNEYKLLFTNRDGAGIPIYYLASSYVQIDSWCWFGIMDCGTDSIGGGGLYSMAGMSDKKDRYVRPVVTLKSGITITKDATHDGSTLAKACTISE